MKIELRNIWKAFGQNSVLKGVNIMIQPGEVHALVGENGAGKSTLMNILTGLLKADRGEIMVDGKAVQYPDAMAAEQAGISFIHQEMNNYSEMSVLDNMFINREIKNKFGLLDEEKMAEIARKYLAQMGSDVNIYDEIGSLPVGKQQVIEIAKSLMTKAQVIIMDEPTAALTQTEIKSLFKNIQKLKAQNVSFIYISHRMEEIFQITDTVTVMRDGVSVSSRPTAQSRITQLVKDMVGRDIGDFYPKRTPQLGKEVLKVSGLSGASFSNVNFQLHEGEILGFSGLMGAGRTETMRAIFGVDRVTAGDIYVHGQKNRIANPAEVIKENIGFLTENRKDEGLILDFNLKENIVLPSIDGFKKGLFIDEKAVDEFTEALIKRLGVKAMSEYDLVSSLSGGNQQKAVLAKWIGAGTNILILDEPTRGVDVGAKKEIYDLMNELTDRKVAIILVSSDLPELIAMSDRIEVMYEGQLVGELDGTTATQEQVMALATKGK
ncbi:MAG: sugar ABC transporter ATP-binding protein [Oenococcus sp.]|uniref:Ribose ABC transport system ATP-binding protein n=1 Tax=Oenococcus kitaharae DSM 17330 TaxID=1045004 RepID=G9WJ22_9LACO|nr:sugar ABC transporter ATP-binding protein [Oenococcus kitaharae]EHN58471.1 Ribose ABC transport system ATP-binding protein [Oenococcus kitaharae DSM 17330]MCV3296290.1 sugar ABC transporter ATP-binding protein [Oenococcus kitaharae]OEY81375.1 D-ribose transporter ATP-binding protein [Oenococcus kitaharae]OEY82863.1 D-ribose transporter ATP-binding protein [Oenococcus kitaharae]OEY84593.1 D-ribose transporter ATP-binding protein [Oenococcus kitaharae]